VELAAGVLVLAAAAAQDRIVANFPLPELHGGMNFLPPRPQRRAGHFALVSTCQCKLSKARKPYCSL
jgi:hypothetical protein